MTILQSVKDFFTPRPDPTPAEPTSLRARARKAELEAATRKAEELAKKQLERATAASFKLSAILHQPVNPNNLTPDERAFLYTTDGLEFRIGPGIYDNGWWTWLLVPRSRPEAGKESVSITNLVDLAEALTTYADRLPSAITTERAW